MPQFGGEPLAIAERARSRLRLPITWGVVLITANVALLVVWIVLLVRQYWWGALTIGSVAFALMLTGLGVYMFLTIKAVRLNQRQANFVDSVTHELKSPIASLRLYLETLQMRTLDESRRAEFYAVMERELMRLDNLISHLLEVARLDAIGHDSSPEDIPLEPLLRRCAETACAQLKCDPERVVTYECEPAVVNARPIVLEMIFGNLLDNAIKYGGPSPQVEVQVETRNRNRVVTRVIDNGPGVPQEVRRKIFQIFYRGGNELERRQKGTGLGLYIVKTLVQMLRGRINVYEREGRPGSVFEVELPGRQGP